MEWRPIESAPKEKDVLCFLGPSRPPVVAGNFYGEWLTYDDWKVLQPTHWMELPLPPTE